MLKNIKKQSRRDDTLLTVDFNLRIGQVILYVPQSPAWDDTCFVFTIKQTLL